jgi:chemotaxis protein MotA
MSKAADEEHAYLQVMRLLIASFMKGVAPMMAAEIARRAIPGHVRPSFVEMEQVCRGGGTAAAAAAASGSEG